MSFDTVSSAGREFYMHWLMRWFRYQIFDFRTSFLQFVNFIVYTRPRLINHIDRHRKLVVSDEEVKSSTGVAIVAFFLFSDETTLVKKTGTGTTQLTQEAEPPQANNPEVEEEVAEGYGA